MHDLRIRMLHTFSTVTSNPYVTVW